MWDCEWGSLLATASGLAKVEASGCSPGTLVREMVVAWVMRWGSWMAQEWDYPVCTLDWMMEMVLVMLKEQMWGQAWDCQEYMWDCEWGSLLATVSGLV